MAHSLAFVALHFLYIGHSLIELQSMEIVSCANKNICHENKNLRIVVKASAIETAAGAGAISGIITGGQTWNDLHGEWELLESLNIDIEYHDAVWEYQLEHKGTFWTKNEDLCGPMLTSCDDYEHGISCPNKGDWGLVLNDGTQCTKYAIEDIETWEASVSIQSTHLNLEWEASNIQHSLWESNAEIYLASVFDTASCYQNLSNQYYVVVPSSAYQYYYFISKQYWQDARNNFNLSLETWQRDFDCDFAWQGWHTIVPFYESDDDYVTLGEGSNVRMSMSNDQLHAFSNGYIPAFYDEVMGTLSGDCSDDTTFTDNTLRKQGPPQDDKYIVSKNDIVDHFELTLDLDYTQFVQMPTHAPTPNPTKFPTLQPTQNPSLSPTTSPTLYPTPLPSKVPTQPPTQPPTEPPTQPPTQPPTTPPTQSPTDSVVDTFVLYEITAKLEITSASPVNISSETVQSNIIQSIASGLNYGREYIRLDSADFITTISSRRLQANTENLVLGFTIFTTSQADQSTYSTKLEETATYHLVLSSLTEKLPDTLSIFIANAANHCNIGTKAITIAGDQRCQSICGLNQYYDTPSASCKDQVEFMVTTSITKDTSGRMMYLGIGVAGWIVTAGAIYAAYRCCVKSRDRPKTKKSRKSTKKSIQRAVYEIGSTDPESSEFSEGEFKSMKRRFTASLTRAVKRTKKKKGNKEKKVRASLLSQESSEESETASSSGSEFSTESNTESESDASSSQSSTETE